jgi:hypothetical protein
MYKARGSHRRILPGSLTAVGSDARRQRMSILARMFALYLCATFSIGA